MRVEADNQRERVNEYADGQGLKMPQAYSELIAIDLAKAAEEDNDA